MMAPVVAADEHAVSDADVRKAVERSLPFLEREGVAWMEEHNCLSCHHVPFLLWSHNAAKSGGIAVDEVKLARWGAWAAGKSMSLRGSFTLTDASLAQLRADGVPAVTLAQMRLLLDKAFTTENEFVTRVAEVVKPEELAAHRSAIVRRAAPPNTPGKTDGGGLDTMAQLLLGGGHGERGLPADFMTLAPGLMVAWQQPDGHWQAAGQLPNQNRPAAERDAVATKWAALALGTLDHPSPEVAQGLARALSLVKGGGGGAGKSTESFVTSALIAWRFGEPARVGDRVAALLRLQNGDGGWPWAVGGHSDAFATGQALYALGLIGAPEAGPAIDHARRYLIQTQQEDGSWPTTGEGISNAATPQRKKKVAPIYRYWGTAWATIGLSSPAAAKKAAAP